MLSTINPLVVKFPYGRKINHALLVADYRGRYQLEDEVLKEWAVLDTFDKLSPFYDSPQTIETMKQWFRDAELEHIDVRFGYNGIEGRGTKQKATELR